MCIRCNTYNIRNGYNLRKFIYYCEQYQFQCQEYNIVVKNANKAGRYLYGVFRASIVLAQISGSINNSSSTKIEPTLRCNDAADGETFS